MGVFEFLKRNKEIIIVALILIFTFVLIYSPHFNYKYPMHGDEWIHIGDSKKFSLGEQRFAVHETGFQLFLVLLTWLGFDLILIYRFLPAIFACISSIILFLLIKRKTNFYCGILAMIFFALLPSRPYILGLWFFTPLTFAIPLIYLFVLLFTEGVEQDSIKKVIYSFIIILFILFIHPSSVLFMIPIIAIYMLFNLKFLKKNWLTFLSACIIPLISLIWFSILYWRGDVIKTIVFFLTKLKFNFGKALYIDEFVYFFPNIYGWLAFLLAFVGVFFGLKKKNMKIFIIWVLVTLGLIWMVSYFEFSLLARYQRMLYYTMLGFIALSAFGLYALLKKSFSYFKKKKFSYLFLGITLIIVFLVIFNHYFDLASSAPLYYDVEDDDYYEALLYLKEFNRSVVLTTTKSSMSVYPIAGHDVVSCAYGRCLKIDENVIDNKRFFNETADCSEKEEILKKYKVSFILSNKTIDCGWKKIFENTKYIYDVRYLKS